MLATELVIMTTMHLMHVFVFIQVAPRIYGGTEFLLSYVRT